MVLVLPASANPVGVVKDISRFVSDLWEISQQYENGEISKSEFIDKTNSSMVRFDINYGADITHFKDVLNVFEFCGIDVPDKWREWFYENKMGGGGSGGHRDDFFNGYGAVMQYTAYISNHPDSSSYRAYTYCEYITVERIVDNSGNLIYRYRFFGDDIYSIMTDGVSTSTYVSVYNDYVSRPTDDVVVYGDVRNYDDDTPADDLISEIPEPDIPNYDDDSVSDDDLIDFLEDLLQELMLEFPDLSTVEGLLRAILAKLGTLDSDNDNELLCSILTAIQALKSSDNPEATEDLTNCLEEIKNDLVYNDGENSATLAEQLNALVENQIKLSDITIDASLYNQRFELIQTKLLGKFSFIPDIKNFIDYALNAYSSSTSPNISFSIFGNSYNIDFSAFDDSINLIRFCIAAFCYLSFAFVTFRKIPSYINGGDNL